MKVKEFINTLKTKPYSHQIDGIIFGIENDKFLLGDTMGLGKTKQVIDIANFKKQDRGYKHCLIICGVNGLKYNWLNEVSIHSDLDAKILGSREGKKQINNVDKLYDLQHIDEMPYFIITNIESLRYKTATGQVRKYAGKTKKIYNFPIADEIVNCCRNGDINMIAVDEIHMAKNPDSEQGKQLLRLKAETQIAMTGTPLLNSPIDLFVPLNWLDYEKHNFFQYKVRYCRFGGYGGKEIIGYKNVKELTSKLDGIMLRRLKEEVLDLPEKIYTCEYVEMNKEQESIYKEVKAELTENIDKIVNSPNPLSELIRLRQATGHTSILSTKISESAKVERLKELVHEITLNNEKAVIFSNWSAMTKILLSELKEYNPSYITGETPDNERIVQVYNFQNNSKCKVIIGTIGAMGTGLTLTAGTNVIFVDEPWNNGIKEQAVDRCHRIGTKSTVNVITLLTRNTIDEKIYSIVQGKKELSDAIVDRKEYVKYLLS